MKEAQEKMKEIIKASLLDNDEELAEQIASDLIALGYRKPLDRLELRGKIETILRAHIVAYEKAWLNKSTFGSRQENKATDQLLALIPDIPEGEPPLLMGNPYDYPDHRFGTEANAYARGKKAQRDSDIKYYKGDKKEGQVNANYSQGL